MNPAMLDYDNFNFEAETQERHSLADTLKIASNLKTTQNKGVFYRIKDVGPDEFVVVKIPAADVYTEWLDRFRQRWHRMSRRSSQR